MADHSLIEWTDATWNPITGCSVVSPGCTNCYAMKLAGTRLKHIPSRVGLTRDGKAGPVWNGQVRLNEQWLDQPLRWKKPRKIFVCAHGDLFAENVPDEWIDRVFGVMALAPQHTFQVLTKRSARMREYITSLHNSRALAPIVFDLVKSWELEPRTMTLARTLPNVWLGVSAEDQARADERIPELLATPAAVRFLSAEPLLGPIDLTGIHHPVPGWPNAQVDALRGLIRNDGSWTRINLVIVGGESGPGARPTHPQWVRSLRDQCAARGTAFFFKQWGAFRQLTAVERGQACGATFIPGCDRYDKEAYVLPTSKKAAGRMLDGVEHSAMPEVL
jgi:protein gp37